MKKIIVDLKNYVENGSIFNRTAVRGIICHEGKYLIIHSKYGEYKFPGGGMKPGEKHIDTLKREVKEKTGFTVKPETVEEYVYVLEKRKGEPEDLMIMDSYYYFCDIENEQGERNLDDYEKEYNYQVSWMSLDDIIKENAKITDFENIPWVIRENKIMKRLKLDNELQKYNKKLLPYYDENRKLIQYPNKKPMRVTVLERIAVNIDENRDYTEKEINEIIKENISFSDVELVRREMFQYKYLGRTRDGSRYWKEEGICEIFW